LLTVSEYQDAGELVGEGLSCRRGERLVFAGLDCRVDTGQALLVTGRNGSGKSSLLRLLATLLAPFAGRLTWRGAPVFDEPAGYRAALHYVGHLDAIKPTLKPREMLRFWAALRGPREAALDAAIDSALGGFGLAEIGDWPCRWLSAGQRRRLGLARLLASPAPLWLLDEPNSALDRDGEACLVDAIAQHRAAGGSVVLATHQPIAVTGALSLVLDDFAVSSTDALALAW
jgi:heme exporter protein A